MKKKTALKKICLWLESHLGQDKEKYSTKLMSLDFSSLINLKQEYYINNYFGGGA